MVDTGSLVALCQGEGVHWGVGGERIDRKVSFVPGPQETRWHEKHLGGVGVLIL